IIRTRRIICNIDSGGIAACRGSCNVDSGGTIAVGSHGARSLSLRYHVENEEPMLRQYQRKRN
ncbi:hypothetical protein Dimus_037655, partial [Dionaea muscipula]